MTSLPLLILFVFLLSLYLAVKAAQSMVKVDDPVPAEFENVVLGVRVPKGNERQPLSAEQMFSSLHGLLRETPDIQEHLSFEITSSTAGINFYIAVPSDLKEFVTGQIYAQYPDAEIRVIEDYTSVLNENRQYIAGATLELNKEQYIPIRTFRDFEVDPLAALTGSLSELQPDSHVWWQLLVRPVPDDWQEEGHDHVAITRGEKKKPVAFSFEEIMKDIRKESGDLLVFLLKSIFAPQKTEEKKEEKKEKKEIEGNQKERLSLIENKLTKLGFAVHMRVVASASSQQRADDYVRRVVASFRQYTASHINGFKADIAGDASGVLSDYQKRTFPSSGGYVLNTEELASIYHFPNETVETPAISWSPAKHNEPPLSLPIDDCTFFGRTTYRDHMIKFGIKQEDRRRHMYLIGKTGTGKSTVFKAMIKQDMEEGKGLAVIDPHGDLIDELLEMVPDNRVQDVVVFDPSDTERPVSLNMLEAATEDVGQRNLLASGLLGAFRKNFEFSWGPRLEYLLNNAILTLVNVERTTLLGITRLLTDKNYRKYIVHKINDPVLKDFWETEYMEFAGNSRLATEAVAPIQNKVGRFLASSTIRNILGQAHSTIKLGEIMNEGKILLITLSKGRIGEDNANLLGSLIVSRLNFTAMQRVEIPESKRRDFYLYVDEFQNFASGNFASILSEARKYRLNLILTHQFTKQLPEELLDAIVGNVGTMVALTLGAPDAALMAKEFEPVFSEVDLISLEKYNFYCKLMIDGAASAPFSGVTLPPEKENHGNREKVMNYSRLTYGNDKARVEELIQRWVKRDFDLGMAKAEEMKEKEVNSSSLSQ